MALERRQSQVGMAVALWCTVAASALGGCAAGANAPGDVQRSFDEASRRWVSTMTPIEIDEVRPEATLTLGARVEQVEVDTADGALLTSWVELEFVVTTELTRNTEFTRVQAGEKVETEGEMQLIGQSWPHLNCRSASLRADGAPIQLTPADLEGERAAYEGRVINEDGRAVALEETIRGRIPADELAQLLGARRSRGDLCGTRFELSAGDRKDLGALLNITSRSPLAPAVAPEPEQEGAEVAPAEAPANTRRIRPPVRQRTVVPQKGPGAAPAPVPQTPTVGRRPAPAPAAKATPAPRPAAAAPSRPVPSRPGARPVVRGQHSRVVSQPAAPAVAPAALPVLGAPGQPAPGQPATVTTPAVSPAPVSATVPAAVPATPAAPEGVDPFAPAVP